MKICKKATISGKVQGVFYRQNTLEQARKLNLTGWVKNLENGNVELVACGSQESIDTLCEWLWNGPRAAKVDHVEILDTPLEEFSSFEILR